MTFTETTHDHQTAMQDEDIRELAYQLWEAAGKPEGRDGEFWHEARARLMGAPVANSTADDAAKAVAQPPIEVGNRGKS